jgi:hypothetical protein
MEELVSKKREIWGIDGWIELDCPVQVKQSEDIGRNVVDNFETAIRRVNKARGVIVSLRYIGFLDENK